MSDEANQPLEGGSKKIGSCTHLRPWPPTLLAPVSSGRTSLRHTEETFLPLLPSGPDGVQKPTVAQDPAFYAAFRHLNWRTENLWTGIQSRYSGLRVQGTATSPSSTTFSHWKFGGADGIRTHDLQIANLALSQLSYCPRTASRNFHGGERGIRTLGSVLRYTRFPVVHLRPLGHLSSCERTGLAERVGFEPTVTVRPQRFSRPPLSTTQAPLLKLCRFARKPEFLEEIFK